MIYGVTLGPKKALYERSYGGFSVDVYMLSQHRTIVYEMEGYIMPEKTNDYIDDLLDTVRLHRPLAMIADPRKMKVLSDDFRRAVQTRFWPEIARLGVRKNPAIDPSGAVTRSSVNRMVRDAGQTIDVGDGRTLEIAVLGSLEECLTFIGQR